MLTIAEFERNQEKKHAKPKQFTQGYHPSKSGIGKKDTSFYPGCCNVRFNRKTLPKSGKSIIDGCFVEDKGSYKLVWDRETRCLLGLDVNKIPEYKRKLNELRERTSNGNNDRIQCK